MAARITRRRRRGKPTPVSRERRRAQQRAVAAQVCAAVAQVVQQAVEGALQAEVTALVGREKYARRTTAPHERAGVRCVCCGADWRQRFWRAGSYARTLLTLLAAVVVRVPRVACRCGGTVPVAWTTIGPYERGWGDLQERARELAGLCVSLRDARVVLAWTSGQPVACSTLTTWVQQAAHLAEALRVGPLATVPAVVLLDGVWLKRMVPTGETYRDRQGRERRRVRRVKAVLLVAYGLNPATGERWVLDWERADGEDEASWQRLLERLHRRGLRTDAGFELFVHDGSGGLEAALGQVDFGPGGLRQRCVFHVLQNVRDAVRGEVGMDREAKRARRHELLQDAAAIWQTTDRATVYRRWRAFGAKWQAREPKAVATLRRVFRDTLAYLEAVERGRERGEEWRPAAVRTTSALERVNRAIRQKARQVGLFHADLGLTAALGLVIAHRRLGPAPAQRELWTEVLEASLLAS